MATTFPIPPTFADPVTYDEVTRKAQFNPLWLKWFLDLSQQLVAPVQHNALSGLQGGTTGQFYHLSQADYNFIAGIDTPVLGAVAFGDGSSIAFTAVGTVGQVLISQGPLAPVWADLLPASAPAAKTADFTVAASDLWLINDKAGSTCTVTLPTPSTLVGRVLHFQNYQPQALVSASSNVIPLTGGAASTAVLSASAGDTCTLVSNGTAWVMTQYRP